MGVFPVYKSLEVGPSLRYCGTAKHLRNLSGPYCVESSYCYLKKRKNVMSCFWTQSEDIVGKTKLNVPVERQKQFSKVLAEIRERAMPSS